MRTVKIDVDGVIRDMFDNMCHIYNDTFGENINISDIYDYDVDKVFKKIREKLRISAAEFFFDIHAKYLFLDSKPYQGVKETIERLIDNNYRVVIATWQYTLKNKQYTLDFLDRYNIPYDSICFTKDKWLINADWLIDDNPEFILDKREKAKNILINMPYNKNVLNTLRCDNLPQAVDIILSNNY